MQKFKGVIYQAINIQNKKSYIGKTIQNFEEYKENHINNALEEKDLKNSKKGKYFYNAIRKYNPYNFKWIILGEIESYNIFDLNEQLNEAEIESIWLFRTFGNNGETFDSIYGYNCTKGGDGTAGVIQTDEHKKRRFESTKLTLLNNPSIIENQVKKFKYTIINNPLIIANRIESFKCTCNSIPDYQIKKKQKEMKTKINNPEIMKKAGKKQSQTKKNNPEILIEAAKKQIQTKKNNPEIVINAGMKCSKTRILNKSGVGKKHGNYIKLNYEFIILLYFTKISIINLCIEYNNKFNTLIKPHNIKKILTILNFPKNTLAYNYPHLKEIYLKFVEENKHKIQWYIDNYERLEEEYYEKIYYEKYKDILNTNI